MVVCLYTETKLYLRVIIIIAVVYQRIIGFAFYEPNKYSIHAEKDCLIKANPKHFKNSYIVLVNISLENELVQCNPCEMCQNLINKYKIKKVVCFYSK